jgi:hypothetical protein
MSSLAAGLVWMVELRASDTGSTGPTFVAAPRLSTVDARAGSG